MPPREPIEHVHPPAECAANRSLCHAPLADHTENVSPRFTVTAEDGTLVVFRVCRWCRGLYAEHVERPLLRMDHNPHTGRHEDNREGYVMEKRG